MTIWDARASAQCTEVIQTAELLASDPHTGDKSGTSVAISGDTAVVGAPFADDPVGVNVGAAYVFTRSGTFWTQQARLVASDYSSNDRFGSSVAINGNTIIVGASFGGAAEGGVAYIFQQSGTVWTQVARLLPSGLVGQAKFGAAVALGSLPFRSIAIVGAPRDGATPLPDAGSAFVYTLDTLQLGSLWTQVAQLTASDRASFDEFGGSVAISGSGQSATVVVGAAKDTNVNGLYAGAAYVFTSNSVGTGWTQQVKLITSDLGSVHFFEGTSVGIAGDTVLLAAPLWRPVGASAAWGAVYFFTRQAGVWTQGARLSESALDDFGSSVAITGDSVVIGSPRISAGVPGSASLYTRPAGSGITGVWTLQDRFTASNATPYDGFGEVVGLSAGRIVGGSHLKGVSYGTGNPIIDAGTAHVFNIGTPCRADFNCTGGATVADIFAFLTAWFANDPRADFNAVGGVTVADIFAFLTAWFAGCP